MNSDQRMGWPSALVAVALLGLVATITVAAITRYSVDDALKIWTPLTALLGVIAGALVSYFFTRSTVQQVTTLVRAAEARAERAETALFNHRVALRQVAGRLQPEVWAALLEDPAVARAIEG